MQSTIDPAGRIVIPKAIRESLGLTGGQSVEIRERDGTIEIEPAPTPMTLVDGKGGPVAVPKDAISALTDDIVRTTLERTRR
jgi:AbrB family looped-hinge helix DNA binding protein